MIIEWPCNIPLYSLLLTMWIYQKYYVLLCCRSWRPKQESHVNKARPTAHCANSPDLSLLLLPSFLLSYILVLNPLSSVRLSTFKSVFFES